MMLPRRPLGSTGFEVSPITFGTSALASLPGTYGYEVSEERARATLHAILDSDGNVLDTSRNYGFGRAEERIGAVFAELGGKPDGLVLSTKVDRDDDTGRFDAAQVRRSFEQSLEALGVDRVDILHLHDPEHARDLGEVTAPGGAIDELFIIKDEGLTSALGVAMGRTDIQLDIVRRHPWDVVLNHNRYTLLNRRAIELFDYARSEGMGVMNAAPYAGGMLAKGSENFDKINYQDADEDDLAPVRALERLCREHGVPLGAVALQFSMRSALVDTTVLGVSKPERVEQSIEWATAAVPDELWAAIDGLPFSTDDPEANRVWSGG